MSTKNFTFRKATKKQARLRMTIDGPAGSGKTFSALRLATRIVETTGGEIAVIDTEHGSASKYADLFDFQTLELDNYDPENYVAAIRAAEDAGFKVCVIDSLSHAWNGKGGALEQVDNAAARSKGNSYVGWRDVTPKHNALVEAILQSPMHIITTMRSKMAYVLETNEKGRQVPVRVGMQPVQRDGMEYEFDVIGDMDMDNTMLIGKTRCPALRNGVFKLPGEELADTLLAWLSDGADDPRFRRADKETVSELEASVERIEELDPEKFGPNTRRWWDESRFETLRTEQGAQEALERMKKRIEQLEQAVAA